MISVNDIIYLSRLHKNKSYKEIVDFITKKIPSDNIIDLLNKIKNIKYLNDNSAIKLSTEKGELVIYKENFLNKLPNYKESIHIIDGFFITIGYPTAEFFSNASFIKKIEKDNNVVTITKDNYNDIPLTLIKKCSPFIEKYKQNLNNIYVYYVNEKYNSRFSYTPDVINYIVYLCMFQDYERILEEQILLMRYCSFTYQDFNHLTYEEFKKYMQLLIKSLKNERATR